MSDILSSFETEISAVAISMVADIHHADEMATWNAGNHAEAASAYIVNHHAAFSLACYVLDTRPVSDLGADAIEVTFRVEGSKMTERATVWFEPLIERLYGEW